MTRTKSLLAVLLIAIMFVVSGCSATTPAINDNSPAVMDHYDGIAYVNDSILKVGTTAKYSGKTICGYTIRHSEGYCEDVGAVIHIEADYGITATADKMVIYINGYNHTDRNITIKSAVVNGASAKNLSLNVKMNSKTKIDTKNYKTGLYCVTAKFSTGKSIDLYFFVNTNAASPCTVDNVSYKSACDRRIALNKAVANAINSDINGGFATDGSKSIDLTNFYYPNYTFGEPNKYRCDTQKWADLSNKICDKNWSKEHKAYVIALWIKNNIAYDWYRVDTLDASRSNYYKDYSGKQSVWDLRAGTCWDFSNIYAIMCRAQGIPCTTMGSDSQWHQWNLVQINGRWLEIDLANYSKYDVNGKDTSKKTLNKYGDSNFAKYAFTVYPNNRSTPKDLDVNTGLNYGNPDNPNDDVYYLS